MNTYTTKAEDIRKDKKRWFLVDADSKVLGRLASRVAQVLRGKHKAYYSPHLDCGDFVIVVNAEKVRVTGRKPIQKIYYHHTGYMCGGFKSENLKTLLNRKPEDAIRFAVHGMLPKGPLGRALMRKLRIYRGAEHDHVAQQPVTVEIE